MRTAIALVSAGAAVGYAVGRRLLGGGSGEAGAGAGRSLPGRAREVPGKLRALGDLGIEQARQRMESMRGSVRIVAAAPPEPDADD